MAIFDVFRKKTEQEKKELEMKDLENFLENFLGSSGLDSKISMLRRDLSSKVIRLNELLNELEYAKLKEEKVVPERIRSIFEGNKKAFIDKVRAFIPELRVPENKENIDEFLESLSEKINSLSEDTQKNYFVIKEFAEDHVRPVTAKIKDIDSLVSNARADIDKTPLSKVKEIKTLHKKHDYLLKEIENLAQELEHTVKMKESELERKSKFDSKLDQLKETKSYEEYKTLLEREKEITKKIKEQEQEIHALFSKLEHALKKRHKITQNELLEKYASKPSEAILEDTELKILSELSYIKENIKELALKAEKKEVVLAALEQAGEERLSSLRAAFSSLKEELEAVISRIKDNHYERSLKEREIYIESVSKNIEAIEKKQQDIEDLIERLNPKYVKQKIKDILKLIDAKVELK
ncbi:MAG: hypothetical protein ACP5N3_06265 [Candidatus Nanoarchaeia archaeon]